MENLNRSKQIKLYLRPGFGDNKNCDPFKKNKTLRKNKFKF